MVSALEHTFHSLRLYLFYSFHPTWSARSLCALLRPLHEARLEVPLHSCGGTGGAGGHTRSEPPRPGARSPPARNAHMSSCLVVGLFFFFFQSTSKVKPVFHLTLPRSICDQPPALGGVRRLQPRAFCCPLSREGHSVTVKPPSCSRGVEGSRGSACISTPPQRERSSVFRGQLDLLSSYLPSASPAATLLTAWEARTRTGGSGPQRGAEPLPGPPALHQLPRDSGAPGVPPKDALSPCAVLSLHQQPLCETGVSLRSPPFALHAQMSREVFNQDCPALICSHSQAHFHIVAHRSLPRF